MKITVILLAINAFCWGMGYISGRDSVEIAHNQREIDLLVERNALLKQSLGIDGSPAPDA